MFKEDAFYNMYTISLTVEELQHFRHLSKLQVPTRKGDLRKRVKLKTEGERGMECICILCATELGEININATDMRKLTSTKVAVEEDNATARTVASHMTHSISPATC